LRFNDDIAIIQLKSPIEFSSTIQPICLQSDQEKTFKIGKLSSWGAIDDERTLSDTPKVVDLQIMDLMSCILEDHH
jgi:hypothetical protein